MCPLSRALLNIKGVYAAMVYHDRFRLFLGSKHGGWITLVLPTELTARIAEFDISGKMEPFEVDLPCSQLAC